MPTNKRNIFTPDERKDAIDKVLNLGKSVGEVSKDLGIARKTIYFWIKRYKNSSSRNRPKALSSKYVSGRSHPKEYRHKIKSRLIKKIAANPKLGATSLANELKVGRHAIVSLLEELKLNTFQDREALNKIYNNSGRLNSIVKLSIVRAIERGESVSKISKEYGVTRKTIYQWIERYKTDGNVLEKYKSGFEHPKSISLEKEKSILAGVVENPQLSIHSLAKNLGISSHGIYNVLSNYGLTKKNPRVLYSQKQVEKDLVRKVTVPVANPSFFDRVRSVWQGLTPNVLSAPPPSIALLKSFFISLTLTLTFTLGSLYWINIFRVSYVNPIGIIFASVALAMGSFFFLYSIKYYLTLAIVLSFNQDSSKSRLTKSTGLIPNLDHIFLTRYPFISVHIPFYNERNVVERIIKATTSFDYPPSHEASEGQVLGYEVILCDDSTDETTQIIEDYLKTNSLSSSLSTRENKEEGWTLIQGEVKPGVIVKHIHRTTRSGFKGGALSLALTLTDPRAEYISVFDADFVPYPDTLTLFLKYFEASKSNTDLRVSNTNLNESKRILTNDAISSNSSVAAVQGYQWHVLNKSENWITRGVRSEYAGSYVIERSGAEVYQGLKQISGSVYMIKRQVLDEVGWGTSITEDFELTLKLYEKGYKVLYTPYIQAPAECVSTIKRLVRQRMRWAEGHSYNVRRMFVKLLTSPKLTKSEKLEFLYLSPYYLQAAFFIIGTISWFISETIFPARLPFWTALWGWSLVITNLIALPLMNGVGLFLEESEEKDYMGLLSFIALSYLVVPFQAYASIKGFLEKEEGGWFRTPKTGRITDILNRGMFARFIAGILPGRTRIVANDKRIVTNKRINPYLLLSTANNAFNDFKIYPKKSKWVGNLVLAIVLVINLTVTNLAFIVPKSLLAYDRETIKVVSKNDLILQPKTEISKREEIKSQVMTKFNDGEVIFHKEPRLRYKSGNNELEFETIGIKGLGKMKSSKPYKQGSVYTYLGVFDKVNLTYRIESNTLKEEFELEEYQSFDYIEQKLKLIGFVIVKDQDGTIKIAPDSGGNAKLVINQPFMFEKNNSEVKSTALTYQLEGSGKNYILKKVLSEEGKKWLADPVRQFPVVIDPVITDIYTSNISNIDVKFGPNARKIAYMPNATGGAAWYAFSASDSTVANEVDYNKCAVSTGCELTSEWSVVPIVADGGANEYGPNIWVKGDVIWISFHDTDTDVVYFKALDTTSDTFVVLVSPSTTICSFTNTGETLGNNNYSYIAVGTNGDVVVGYSSTSGDTEADLYEVATGTCTFTSIESGSGMPASSTTMQPVAIAIGNKIHIVYDDAANEIRHSVYDVSSNSWDFTDQVADNGNVLNDDYSVTTDGTDLWLFYMDAANSTVLQKCTGTCMTSGAGSWTNLTAPFTTGTTVEFPAITYFSSSNVLRACIVDGAASTTQDVTCKDSPSGSISWGSPFSIGLASADWQELSTVMSVPTTAAEQFALVAGDITNSDFTVATVPENLWLYMITAPFLLLGLRKLKERKILSENIS